MFLPTGAGVGWDLGAADGWDGDRGVKLLTPGWRILQYCKNHPKYVSFENLVF